MLIAVEVIIPDDALAAAGVDTRYTFRRTLENRLRPRMNRLRDEAASSTIYPAIADAFSVQQETTGDSVAFVLQNTNPASTYLEAPEGTKPHHITQRPHMIPRGHLVEWYGDEREAASVQHYFSEHDIEIEHPGTAPDQPVLDAIAAAEDDILNSAADAIDAWIARFGAVEIS